MFVHEASNPLLRHVCALQPANRLNNAKTLRAMHLTKERIYPFKQDGVALDCIDSMASLSQMIERRKNRLETGKVWQSITTSPRQISQNT